MVVMTYNEAQNIERCLASVRTLADECLVVDSFSTDDTVARAAAMGARILEHPFHSYNAQRAFAAEQATHDFILALDADEYVSDELATSIQSAKQDTTETYTFNRRNRIGNKWMRSTSWYPDRKLRLFDRRRVRFEGSGGHDVIVPLTGISTAHLSGDLLHHTSTDLHDRMQQVNKLTTASARHQFEQGKRGSYLRLLVKPPVRFLVEYVLRGGFRDGFYGFTISRTAAMYVFLREAKLLEMNRSSNVTM